MIQKSTKKSYLVFIKENIKMKSVQSTVAQYYRLHSDSVFLLLKKCSNLKDLHKTISRYLPEY